MSSEKQSDLILLSSFENPVEVLSSAAHPKKVIFIGTNGKRYPFLCKPKDDLRRDARMMEFNILMTKLLKKNPDTRQRSLHVRTYGVVPLNEEDGIIEWVLDTVPMRTILSNLYTNAGIDHRRHPEMVKMTEKKDWYTKEEWRRCCQLVPPIFYKWFLNQFPEPSSWFRARLSFARTAAVMSVIGYIVGLGDRHCENILFDASTGETIHVDFNCLFLKGMTLTVVEKVPFRLTPNMVDALGVTAYEGTFRKVCELTLSVMKSNKETLVSILETFIGDPLVEWAPTGSTNSKAKIWTDMMKKAGPALKGISDRLDGKMRDLKNEKAILAVLSVGGHIDALITEATREDNLAGMYKGWTSWL